MAPWLGAGLDRFAESDEDLQADQVQSGDHLGHRMFHLETSVHLDEVEMALLVDEELDGPSVDVAGRLRDRHCRVSDPRAQLLVDDGRRRLFDELLVSALERAVPFPQEGDMASGIGQDLGLHVVGPGDVALQIDLRPTEVRSGLAG